MSSKSNNGAPPTQPIPISTRRGRADSLSDASSSSEESASPASPLHSPLSGLPPRIAASSPGSAPILSYFLSQSPKSPSTFPFRRGFGTAVFDGKRLTPGSRARAPALIASCIDDSEPDTTLPRHARSASISTSWGAAPDRVSPPAPAPALPIQEDRAAGLLRRLSLGGTALRVRPLVSLLHRSCMC